MTLQEKLDAYKREFVEKVPEEKRAVMERATEDLKNSGILDNTIKVGDRLPSFELKNHRGETVRSEDILKDGPLVISFFRGKWCPYCNIEIKELEAYADKFRDAGARLVVISPQLESAAKATVEEHDLSFDVLIDEHNAYAKELGIAFSLTNELRDVYKGFGIDLPEYNGDDSWELPMPTRLVVDRSGQVVYADINPDYTKRPDPRETLEALREETKIAA